MPKHFTLLMICISCCCTYIQCTSNQSDTNTVAPPITRIIHNYEKHLMKLKEKYDNLHVKRGRLKERSADSSIDARDEVVDDWTKKGDEDLNTKDSAPIALSPFELPSQDIGLLPEPSTNAPKFPHRRRLKYLNQYAKRRVTSSNRHDNEAQLDDESLVTGDTINGMESVVQSDRTHDSNDDFDSKLTRVDGESRKSELRRSNARHDGQIVSRERNSNDILSANAVKRQQSNRAVYDSIDSQKRRLDQLNEDRQKRPKAYSIVNLFKASMSDDKSRESEETTSVQEESRKSRIIPTKEKPMQDNLPIRRLEDAKPVEQQENDLSFNSDEEMPFLMRPDLFNFLSSTTTTQLPYTFATTTIQPTTQWRPPLNEITTTSLPSIDVNWRPIDLLMEESSFITEAPTNEVTRSDGFTGDSQTHLSREVTEEPKRGSTIVDSMEGINELEPANLDTQIDFEKLYQREKRRRSSMEFYSPTELDTVQYEDDNEENNFPFYSRKKYSNQHHRFGFRRKPLRRPYYDEEEDEEANFYPPRRSYPRKGLRFPSRVQRPEAIPLPMAASSSEDQPIKRLEHEALQAPTLKPQNRYSTLMTGIAGEQRRSPPDTPPLYVKNQAPSPEDQQKQVLPSLKTTTPMSTAQKRPELQMSAENCRKVYNYSVLFGVPDPQAWVRKNCAFVQTFVRAPCDDINTFVDSCYEYRVHSR